MGTSTDPHDPKQQARRLRTALGESGTVVSHGQALELVARLHGDRGEPAVQVFSVEPVLRDSHRGAS